MNSDIHRLFVYGSLRSGAVHPMAKMLSRYAEKIGDGYFYGLLKDMGAYPGALYDQAMETKVWGEVFQWTEEAAPWLWSELDQYEGFDAQQCQDSEFIRIKAKVRLEDEELISDLYIYQPNWWEENGQIIPSGDYLQYLEQKLR